MILDVYNKEWTYADLRDALEEATSIHIEIVYYTEVVSS